MSFFPAAVKPAVIASLICSLFLSAGCSRKESFVDYVETDIAKSKVDDLSRSVDFVKNEVRFDQPEFIKDVKEGLNRWVGYSEDHLMETSLGTRQDPRTTRRAIRRTTCLPTVWRTEFFEHRSILPPAELLDIAGCKTVSRQPTLPTVRIVSLGCGRYGRKQI